MHGAARGIWYAAAFAACLAALAPAAAQEPPFPDFANLFGLVQSPAGNLEPAEQPVIAIINGSACGAGETQLLGDGPDIAPSDAGRTAYTVHVAAAGSPASGLAGCGESGDAIDLWFPASGQYAADVTAFASGTARADVFGTRPMPFGVRAPLLSGDGPAE